ncbi:hypothetical protein ASPWEDRAFT_481845 [Aspergillus wentii DTO 134E9]|uniref:Uncharacterized protein n=1 Tax=Aspergillus wentii DTO 134E9 TaxID=1073089 RepID=A0A1L9RIZ4_ASPWE|nr:uncharacterized protein ASPWEDRAFT_481845 [Aspergillus wentii DTO 134E9]OJJ34884.1 hypothetical protein ASPWEDRAFT_481845 [Aspergillus wentii DTO 134E9]
MEEIIPKPLRIAKTPRPHKRTNSSASALIYPWIPCRQSSLRGNPRQCSDESATSTTPPPGDNFRSIRIPKNRQSDTPISKDSLRPRPRITESSECTDESGAHNREIETCDGPCPTPHFPRFFSGWSFRSWNSTMRRLSLDSKNDPTDTSDIVSRNASRGANEKRNETCYAKKSPIILPSRVVLGYEKNEILAPRGISITGVNVEATPKSPIIGPEPLSIWVTAEITADIDYDESLKTGWLTPLDVVIILDRIPQSSIGLLRQQAVSSLAVASSLNSDTDRFAIAYINGNAKDGFGVLLPLGMHSFESAQIAVDTYSLYQLTSARATKSNVRKVVSQVSNMFCHERAALCHIFFVTATPTHFSMPTIDKNIGFHTISPVCFYPFAGPEVPSGWHIFCDMETYDTESSEAVLKNKIYAVVGHLHAGIDPGIITDLDLSLVPGDNCAVQSILEETHLSILRPGEKWIVPIQISVPGAPSRPELQMVDRITWNGSNTSLNTLVNQLHDFFKELPHQGSVQHILTAQLGYKHSLLPSRSVVHTESHCTVVRNAQGSQTALWDI